LLQFNLSGGFGRQGFPDDCVGYIFSAMKSVRFEMNETIYRLVVRILRIKWEATRCGVWASGRNGISEAGEQARQCLAEIQKWTAIVQSRNGLGLRDGSGNWN
jgi:hypothetical protein